MKTFAIALAAVGTGVFAAQAYAQEARLAGRWNAVGKPGITADFKADGEFHYVYDPSPPPTELQIYWKASGGNVLILSMANNQNARECRFRLDGDKLTIDDGASKSCIPNEPINLAIQYERAK